MTLTRIVVAILLLFGFGGAVVWQQRQAAQVPPAQVPSAPKPEAAAPSASAPQAAAPAAAPAPSQPSNAAPSAAVSAPPQPEAPVFDVVRVEPNGDSVLAGRALPSATVELLRSGAVHDRVVADTSGLFAMTPPALPPGEHELSLRFTTPDGRRSEARQTITVVIAADRTTPPIVALTAPGAPTVVLSTPDGQAPRAAVASAPPVTNVAAPPAPAATPTAPPVAAAPPVVPATQASAPAPAPSASVATAPVAPVAPASRQKVAITTVESEEGGKLYVSGQASPGATVRLYLNDSYLASALAGADGAISFSIQGGIRPGDYRVRLDDADVASGQVRGRAEVGYAVPLLTANAPSVAPVASAAPAGAAPQPAVNVPLPPAIATPFADPATPGTVPATASSGSATSREAAAPAAQSGAGSASAVIVPEVKTTIVTRGDSLWRISRRVYGQGIRYTIIYGANDQQIRDPNLIYPGQVFVVPGERG